jgi:hypothetical protein
VLRSAVPRGVCHGLTSDPDEGLGAPWGDPRTGDQIKLHVGAEPLRDRSGRSRDDDLERLVRGNGQRCKRLARFALGPLGRSLQPLEALLIFSVVRRQRPQVASDVGDFLSNPVMQITSDSAPLLEDGGFGHGPPVGADLTHACDEKDQVEDKPEGVSGIEPGGVA